MIPILDDHNPDSSDTLLATIVILRYLEELDDSPSSLDAFQDVGHRVGARIFMQAQINDVTHSSLACAAFWLGVRQEIYFAVRNRRPFTIDMGVCCMAMCAPFVHDGTWANKIASHCVEIIDYCFNVSSAIDQDRFNRLSRYTEDWFNSLPASYQPVYTEFRPKNLAFPEVVYLSNMAVTGVLFYRLGRLLLKAHDPSTPRVGPFSRQALLEVDEEMVTELKLICGTAFSNGRLLSIFVHT